MTDRNDDLAYQVLDYIREHPDEWDQRNYSCGTTACFAGRAIMLDSEAKNLSHFATTGRLLRDPAMDAAALLGWTWYEAQYVFGCMTRNFSVLESRVKEVLNGEVNG